MRTKKGIINALNFKTNDTQQDDTIILQKAIDQGAKEGSVAKFSKKSILV
ncbi:hypothetical protein JCP67_08680 [Enterococcus faecium]|nr:hypothetical protein [Enterococcus faecium]QQA40840.1 hypothetical protein JCP67_08680 [Enterococcus faecium]